MQRVINIRSTKTFQKGGIKPNFALYSERTGLPVILPAKEGSTQYTQYTVQQTTLVDTNGNFKKVVNDTNAVYLLEGTAFTINVAVLDPDNIEDPWDISNLRFKWLKNGSYIHSVNNLNDYKGYNNISFTAEQATRNLTGEYTLEISNGSGTSITAPLTITIYNRLRVPELYNNIIKNSSGEAGTDNWILTNGVVVNEFSPSLLDSSNFASIFVNRLWSSGGDYIAVQPELPFRFCSSNSWVNFNYFYQSWKQGTLPDLLSSFYSWHYGNNKPNIVSNEDPGDDFACFFPSKRYIDDYNANTGKLGLMHEMKEARTYFTKPPIQRNEDPVSKMTQAIDLSNATAFVDGKVCGVENLVGNFFAYVGLGINSYEFKLQFGPGTTQGPGNTDLFQGINNTFYAAQVESGVLRNLPEAALLNPQDIKRELTDRKVSSRDEVRFTNRFSYTPPAWKYPIIKSLCEQSVEAPGGGRDFVDMFKNVLFAGNLTPDQLIKYPELATFEDILESAAFESGDLSAIGRTETQRLAAVERREQAIERVKIAFDNRFAVAEELIYQRILQELNNFFHLDLNEESDNPDYFTLIHLTHALISKHLADFWRPRVGSIPPEVLLSDVLTGQRYDRYRGIAGTFARDTAQPYNLTTMDLATKFSNYYNYTYNILRFYVYEKILEGNIIDNYVTQPAAPDKFVNTLVLDFNGLKQMVEGGSGAINPLLDLSRIRQIDVFPKCNDTVSFDLEYVDAFGEQLGMDTLDGPNEDDIFAVKEKVFLSTVLTKLFQRVTKLIGSGGGSDYVPVTYKGGQEMFTLYKYTYGNGDGPGSTLSQDFLRKTYPTAYFDKLKSSFPVPDTGAAAFFAVNKTFTVPRRTRSINITVNFNHSSIAWGQEADSGINRYDSQEIQAEHLTDKLKFFKSGNPRTGLAHVKLCLFDTTFKRTDEYPNYFVPPRHVWSELKAIISGPQMKELDRIVYGGEDWVNFVYIQPTRESLAAPIVIEKIEPPLDTDPRESADASLVEQAQNGVG